MLRLAVEAEIKNQDTSFRDRGYWDTDDDLREDLETFSDLEDVDSKVSDSKSVNDKADDGTLGYLQMGLESHRHVNCRDGRRPQFQG